MMFDFLITTCRYALMLGAIISVVFVVYKILGLLIISLINKFYEWK